MANTVDIQQWDHDALLGGLLAQSLDRSLGFSSYYYFVTKILGYDFREMTDPTVKKRLTQVGAFMDEFFETRHLQRHFKKLMIVCPRGTVKSSGITIPGPIYAAVKDPDIACGVMSAKYEDIAVKFTAAIRENFWGTAANSRLTELYGTFEPSGKGKKDWAAEWMTIGRRNSTTRADPTVAAYSITKGATSAHYDIVFLDDPVTEEAMEGNSNWLDLVWNTYTRLPAILENDGLFVLVMTRYDDGDLCGRIIREEIEPIVKERVQLGAPAGKLPDDWDYEYGWIKYAHLAGWTVFYDEVWEGGVEGKPRYPVIWPVERVHEARHKGKRGEWFYQTQLRNNPMKRDDAYVTEAVARSRLCSLDDIPPQPWQSVRLHCDFAFKDTEDYLKMRGDFTHASLIIEHNAHIYRINGTHGRPTQEMWGREFIKLYYWLIQNFMGARLDWLTFDKIQGLGKGDHSTKRWIQNLISGYADLPMPRIQELPRTGKKEAKIANTAWAWQEGFVHIVRDMPGVDELLYQYRTIGYSIKDDAADAFSDAFNPLYYRASRRVPRDAVYSMQQQQTTPPGVFGQYDHRGHFTPENRPIFSVNGSGSRKPLSQTIWKKVGS